MLFTKPEDATEHALRTGDFIGINLHTCLERLEDPCGIEFDLIQKEKLRAFKKRRNRFEHFGAAESKEALESSAAEVLSLVLNFIADELDWDELSGAENDSLQQIRASLGDFENFVRGRVHDIEPLLTEWRSGYGQVVKCPCCLQDALKTDLDVVCAFCGYRTTAEEAAEFHVSNVGGTVQHCPNRENQALAYHQFSGEEALCFSCGESFIDLGLCEICGEPFPSEDLSGGMCRDCCRAWIAADHR